MKTDTIKDIDAALAAIESAAGKGTRRTAGGGRGSKKSRRKRRTPGQWMVYGLLLIVKAVLVLILPFLILIRVSVSLYLNFGWNAWLALIAAVILTSTVLMIYAAFVSGKLGSKKLLSINKMRFSGAVVAVYCIYALVFISGANTKTPEVRATYSSLHPVIRVAVGTIVLIDKDLVVTDAARDRQDYGRMGLPVNENSLHYRQDDGHVHAIDIRTVGIPEWQNALVVGYFRLSGFKTLRHTGTADHLHVSLGVR